MAEPLTAVQLAEVQFLADEFDGDNPGFLLAHVLPFLNWCRAEGVTLPVLVATGFENIPRQALAPLVIAAVAATPPPAGETPTRFTRALIRLADAVARA